MKTAIKEKKLKEGTSDVEVKRLQTQNTKILEEIEKISQRIDNLDDECTKVNEFITIKSENDKKNSSDIISLKQWREDVHNGAIHDEKTVLNPMLSQMSSKWSCEKCGPKFHSNDNLCYHRKQIHSKEIKCKTCSKTFENNWKLENHITKHHKPKRIKCDKCDQT